MDDYISFARWDQAKDLERYRNYKKGELDKIDDRELDMRILSLLEELGYPVEKFGTYLYKELISYIYDDVGKAIQTNIDNKELMYELLEPYSGLYRGLASDYLEIGTKSFHKYVKEAIALRDSKNATAPLTLTIKGLSDNYIDYGVQAMFLAAYIYGNYYKENKKENAKEKKISECV